MKAILVGILCVMLTLTSFAQQIFVDGISLSNDYIRNIGFVDAAAWGSDYTGTVGRLGVSIAQMAGINPETGEVITNSANLMPIMPRPMDMTDPANRGFAVRADQFTTNSPLVTVDFSGSNITLGIVAGSLTTNELDTTELDTRYVEQQGNASINGDLDLNNNNITNVVGITLGGGFRTNWPSFTESEPAFTDWLGTNTYVQAEQDPVYTNDLATGVLATGTPLYAFTEQDPIYTNDLASGLLATGTPVYVEVDPVSVLADGSRDMTGTLTINANANNDLIITSGGTNILIGKNASAVLDDIVIGRNASASARYSVVIGHEAKGSAQDSVAIGYGANAHYYGTAIGYNSRAIYDSSIMGPSFGGVGIGWGANGWDSGTAVGNSANASRYGTAIGYNTKALRGGISLGNSANGMFTNIAIGVSAKANSGGERIAIGHSVSNAINESIAVRGTLYLDGGTGVYYRSTLGSGGWNNLLDDIATTNYVEKTGDSMSGALVITSGSENTLRLNSTGTNIAIGLDAYAGSYLGVGYGLAIGYKANGARGQAVGYQANAYLDGTAFGNNSSADHYGVAFGYQAMADYSGAAFGYQANGGQYMGSGYGAAFGYQANGANGVAIGYQANGSGLGFAIGNNAYSRFGGIAIGHDARTGGGNMLALGHDVTNNIANSAAVRGTLYLDGGTGVLYRSTFGSGAWNNLLGGVATGTPLYAYSETDPIYTNDFASGLLATGTPLYAFTEVDPDALLSDGSRAMSGDINLGGNSLTNAQNALFSDAIVVSSNTVTAVAGMIRWNPSINNFEGYNGSDWVVLGNVYAD